MIEIQFSGEEKTAGSPSAANLQAAVRALDEDGFVLLKSIVEPAHIESLRQKMLSDVDAILARPDAPFNFNTGNLQQDPPPFHPYLFRDVLLNDLVISVTREVLGPNLKNAFYSGNTALPGGGRQPVHPDVAQLWPSLKHPTPAFGLVVNIPLVDVSPQNGATELWPGTHHDTRYCIHDGSARITEDALDEWRQKRGPTHPSASAGDVLIRDIRLWHAGMPNTTEQPRPMIAMIHWASWWPEDERVPFPREAEPWLQHPVLKTVAQFVDGEVEYLKHNQSYDLQK